MKCRPRTDNTLEKLCWEEEQRSGTVVGGRNGVEKFSLVGETNNTFVPDEMEAAEGELVMLGGRERFLEELLE